jgi:hypothetical protein
VPALEEKCFAAWLRDGRPGEALRPEVSRFFWRSRLYSLEPVGDKGRRGLPEEVRNERRLLLFSHVQNLQIDSTTVTADSRADLISDSVPARNNLPKRPKGLKWMR